MGGGQGIFLGVFGGILSSKLCLVSGYVIINCEIFLSLPLEEE